jgi:hypothetical protein
VVFTYQAKTGEKPPLVSVAVKVIGAPAQAGLLPPVILIATVGVTAGFTVMLILLEVAVVGDAQLELDVSTQLTDCPLVSDDDV